MKNIGLLALLAFPLASCDSIHQPLDSLGGNPLDGPGSGRSVPTVADPGGSSYTPGSFLQTQSPQTAFFSNFPRAEDQPVKTLDDYVDVKVISSKGSYVKIEVVDTGEVGFVPSVMLGEKRSPNEIPITPGAGEVPVTGLPPEPELLLPQSPDLPSGIAPDPEVPGIEPPEIIDPSLPAQ